MRHKHFYTALIAFVTLLSTTTIYGQKELPEGVSQEWYTGAAARIQQSEYNFHVSGPDMTYRAANSHNRLTFQLQPGGYTITNLPQNNEQEWQVSFSFAAYGRMDRLVPMPEQYNTMVSASALEFITEPLAIQYVNDKQGMRQNFIIKQKPGGEELLCTKINVQTALTAKYNGENSMVFHTPGNQQDIKLIYDGLKVWDANNVLLPASMQLDPATGSLCITVNDDNATYPVTIDPLNRAPEWTTSADGILPGLLNNLQLQVQSLYGYTVAGLGDINGDGYDDVAVSAPTMADVVSGTGSLTGVGAVFIYLGSATGLPADPSKVLQPTTAVTGALFGFSIDAGDITGDGKNDIIISAPMDRYQTQAAGVLGPVNVNVTAGKVYMYRSEDLFTAANPTPFLEIKLQGTGFFSTGILGVLLSNVTAKPLFGYSVAVTRDLNGDNKADVLIGSPAYLGIDILSVQSGAAFVYYSDNLATTNPARLNTPTPTLLGLISLPVANTSGLLFGFSIDGAGDYNGDGFPDVVVGAPAGADLSALGGIFTGQVLGGSAYVYFGTGSGVNANSTVRLQASPSGLLSNAANLFGYKVKGVTTAFNTKNGNILIGAPSGSVLSNVLGGLRVKAGQVHVFKKKTGIGPGGYVSDHTLSSPRSSSILGILAGQTLNVSLLYGSSIDNMLDVNCDGIGDIIVGEPLSTAVPLIGADVVGGAAYIYLGQPDGSYQAAPTWDLHTQVSPLLGVNSTALIGYSVAGARRTHGFAQNVRSLIGGPSNSLDFGVGLLNLGNTLGTTLDFTFDNNGLGKSFVFPMISCNITLPVTLINFRGQPVDKTTELYWASATEENLDLYELQRSTDGVQFEPIAIAIPKGSSRNDYKYTDKHPFKGVNYYRLKMIDKDKKFTYSNIVAVRFDENLPGQMIVAPNPAEKDINIRMTGMASGTYRMELQSTSGQLISIRSVSINQYVQNEVIRTGNLAPGIYWVNVYDNQNNKITTLRVYLYNR